jgi:hypothetical protein
MAHDALDRDLVVTNSRFVLAIAVPINYRRGATLTATCCWFSTVLPWNPIVLFEITRFMP